MTVFSWRTSLSYTRPPWWVTPLWTQEADTPGALGPVG